MRQISFALGLLLFGCSSSSGQAGASGGGHEETSGGTSGTSGKGGATMGSGGTATGGGSATGGTTASGGTEASGGSAETGGSTSMGGCEIVEGAPKGGGAWVDITPKQGTDKCSGVVVNRCTGDVLADVSEAGIYKSTDQGGSWTRIDGGTVGGLAVEGPAFDVDQNQPSRVAIWSLDGTAAWTNDGVAWKKMTDIGRNWDFGGTDWGSPDPKTMIGALHESGGKVYVSTDGASSWNQISFVALNSGAGWPPPAFAMVGVMDATTLVASNGEGIYRSTDTGTTFTKVSSVNVETRVPVLFQGVFYLGGEQGLLVSKDKGSTWRSQGSVLNMWVGPFFGTNETSMVVANSEGVFKTKDAGTTWTKIASLPADAKYDPRVFAGYAWDPIHDILYTAAVSMPVLKMQL